MSKKMRGNLMLLLTALIWGTAFVAQSAGMEHVQPFTYNGIRTLIGGLVLIPVIVLFDIMKPASERMSSETQKATNKRSLIGGVFCGVVLCVASSFQQFGVSMTTAGKAGFITALYIVIVPLMGVFIKKKVPKIIWLCVAIAVAGFYFLCVKEGFSVGTGDLLVLVCAVFFSAHIMVIDHFTDSGVNGVLMSCVQFLVAGTISILLMLIFEEPTLTNIWAARGSILYAGIMSCGVAYTLQILGQRDTDDPTIATLLMSLESVFAALSGWLLLHERLSLKELAGCALVFIAVILAQIPLPVKSKKS
ncbi:MAG: DMT family transporter [Clostridia bacterium]|nr:DMT family transporter [Clostridia bacterium]